jgi:peptidoglycan/LPS O-acetylase OafA/YrhL
MQKKYYRPDIDGLRALAVLSVVAFHAAPGRISAGFIGVDIFFVISGFLITKIILEKININNFSFLDFYSRRVKRIFPSLITILIATFLLSYVVFTDDELLQLCKHIFSGSLFLSNFILLNEGGYFDIDSNKKVLLHLWSLSIEEQFYIVWPLVIYIIFRLNFNPFIIIFILFILSFFYNILNLDNKLLIFYSPFSRFWELLIGSFLSLLVINNKIKLNLIYLNLINIIGFGLLFLGYISIDSDKIFPGWFALYPCIGTFLIIYSGPKTYLNKYILSNNLLVWIGLISFPLYLWHWPLLTFARVLEGAEVSQIQRVFIVFLSIFLSWLTYKFIENPIRYGYNNISYLLITIFIIIIISGYGYFNRGFADRYFSPSVMNQGDYGHDIFFDHIDNKYFPCQPSNIYNESSSWKKTKRCFQSKNNNKIDLAIIGDSHAEHLFPGLANSLKKSNIVFYGGVGEPFIKNKNFENIFNFVLNNKNIKNVILVSNWRSLLTADKLVEFEKNLKETILKLNKKNKKIFISNDIPNFGFHPTKCKYVNRFIYKNKCNQDKNKYDSYYLNFFDQLKTNKILPIFFVDTYNLFCKNKLCSMAKNNELLYRDDNHLNINGSIYLGKKFLYEIKQN